MNMAQMNIPSSEPVLSPRRTMPQAKLAQILLGNPEHTLYQWLPEGELSGNEYKALNPLRNDSEIGSFSINVESGAWADFATGDTGGNLVDLYGYVYSIKDAQQLTNDLETYCRNHKLTAGKAKANHAKPKQKPPTETIPANQMTRLPPDSDATGNRVTQSWEYRTPQNEVSFYVLRTEPEPGKKETKPCRISGGNWVWSYPEGKLPLYNCHLLKSGNTVLFGEGEKTADALHALANGIGMTSAGGSNRFMASDLSPLKKADEIIIFPDADNPGIKYATQVMWYCLAQGVDCQMLNTDALSWHGGEDAADHLELTWIDYEVNLLTTEAWREAHVDESDEALFEVIASLSQAEYDRTVDQLIKHSGLTKSTLNNERKSRLKKNFDDHDESCEVDVSDIDLSNDEKLARRTLLNPVIDELAHSNDILNKAVQVCHKTLGVHNEATLIKLGYLSVVSRLLDGFSDRPVSLMLKGSSGSGKSHVIKQVLKMFRQDATWIILSSISPTGLIYDQRSYRGKVLFLPECNQLVDQDSLLTQLVKTILTEGSIVHLTVDTSDSCSPEGKVITKQGPIALIIGTTRDYLDPELETRALSYYVDETSEQTRNIVLQAAERFANPHSQDEAAIDAALAPWLAFDEWLALSPVRKVSIPFYRQVVEPIANMPVRYRRDLVEMVPGLIKASALVHQANREVVNGTVQATPDDYEHVRLMVNDFLHRVQGDTTTPGMNRLLTVVYGQMSEEIREGKSALTISQPDLAKTLGLTQQAIGYQLKKLIEKGYLSNAQQVANRPAKLKLGPAFSLKALTENTSVLLSAQVLGLE